MSYRPNAEENWALQEQYNPRTGMWLNDAKDILLRFLKDFFGQMPAGENQFHHVTKGTHDYSTDEEETELIISDQGSLNTDTVEKRPALILTRGPFAMGNTSLDQLLGIEGKTGKETHTDLLTGSFVVNCLSSNGLEAERLATIVAAAIRYFRKHLQRAGFFQIGLQVSIGTESPAGSLMAGDAAEDFVNVPVSFPAFYQFSWTYEYDAELLRAIIFKCLAVFRNFDGSLLVPDAINPDGSINEDSEGVIVGAWTVTAP